MNDTIARYLATLASKGDAANIGVVLKAIGDCLSTHCLTSAGLVIKAGASALVKAGTAFYAIANGKLVTKAANTDMAALSGTVTNLKFNVFAFFVNSAGTLSSVMGTEGAALANVVLPAPAETVATIGYLIINPTGTGNFVGGTTAIDDATVVPTALYINLTGPVDPSILL